MEYWWYTAVCPTMVYTHKIAVWMLKTMIKQWMEWVPKFNTNVFQNVNVNPKKVEENWIQIGVFREMWGSSISQSELVEWGNSWETRPCAWRRETRKLKLLGLRPLVIKDDLLENLPLQLSIVFFPIFSHGFSYDFSHMKTPPWLVRGCPSQVPSAALLWWSIPVLRCWCGGVVELFAISKPRIGVGKHRKIW